MQREFGMHSLRPAVGAFLDLERRLPRGHRVQPGFSDDGRIGSRGDKGLFSRRSERQIERALERFGRHGKCFQKRRAALADHRCHQASQERQRSQVGDCVGPGLFLRTGSKHHVSFRSRRTFARGHDCACTHSTGVTEHFVGAVLRPTVANHDHLVDGLHGFEQRQVMRVDRRRSDRSAGQQSHPSRGCATGVKRGADPGEDDRPRRGEHGHFGPGEQ